jgi:hypothetical protein
MPLFNGKAGFNMSSQGSYFDAVSKLMYRVIGSTTGDKSISDMGKLINLPDYSDFSAGISFTPTPALKVYVSDQINTDRTRFCEGDSMIDITYHYNAEFNGGAVVAPETSVTIRQRYYSFNFLPGSFQPSYLNNQPLSGRTHDGNPRPGTPYYNIDTLMNYASKYNILYATAQYAPSTRHFFTFSAAWQKRWWDLDFPSIRAFIDTSIYDVSLDQYNANFGWVYSGLSGHTVKSGLQIDYTRARYDVFIVRYLHEMIVSGSTNLSDFWGPINGDTALSLSNYNGNESMLMDQLLVKYKGNRRYYNAGIYLSDSWDALPRLHIDAGTRIEFSNSDRTTCISPRLAVRFNLTEKHELIGAAGHYTQNNYDISAIALSQDLKPEKVWHGSVGLESKPLPWLTQKFDFYGKYYYDLLSEMLTPYAEKRKNPVDPTGNSISEPDSIVIWDGGNLGRRTQGSDPRALLYEYFIYHSSYVNDGRGYAFGAEYMLDVSPFDFWNGWISLSLGKSMRQRRPGWRWHPFPLDRPLLISVHNYYRLPKKYEVGLTYRYMSGLPYTSITSDNGNFVIGAFNDRRYAEYHRLDIRFSKGFTIKNAKGSFYTEIWNSMNAPNLFQRDAQSKKFVTFSFNLPTTTLFFGVQCTY